MYKDFAYAYDRLMNDVPYSDWAGYYAKLLELYDIRPNARCIECACGTGNLTIHLSKLGFRITGVDLSPDMLNIAQQKAREHGVSIPFVRMDMRKLTVQRPVDAVLATCDGPNYLTASNDLLSFFQHAYTALKPDGVLAFDISTPYKLSERLGDRMFTTSDEDLVYVWQGQYHKNKAILDIHMDIFIKETSGLYRRIQEDQQQKAHDRSEISDLLTKAGYTDIWFFGDRTMDAPDPEALRWHVTARKGAS